MLVRANPNVLQVFECSTTYFNKKISIKQNILYTITDRPITLNKVIEDEQYPIPIKKTYIFKKNNGAKPFCILYISQTYLHMVMDEKSVLLLTLSTHKLQD